MTMSTELPSELSNELASNASSAAAPPPPEAATADAAAAVTPDLGVPPVPKGPRFADLGLHPDVLRALEDMGFQEAMSVQAATLPLARQGKDLMVQSRTGSGKTAAFGIPFVNDIVDAEQKAVQAVVLLPTRELALQVAAEIARIAVHRPITVVPIYGGAPMGRQVELLRAGAQIVCGTPGRVLDHLRRGTLKLDRVRVAVLDECDEMLSMGFQEDIEAILERTPTARQTLLFSATVPEGIQRLSRRFLRDPQVLKLSADFVGVHEIRHVYYSIPAINREQELLRVLNFEEPKTAIVFCNTREETGRIAEFLQKQGFEAEAISSDLAQGDREKVMAKMRAGQLRFLVATDVAARGIDIEGLSHVFNYTFPEAPEIYIHRTGRTGRAGKHGVAVSMIGPTEVGSFYYLKLLYKIRPEERALPSEAEIRSHREGERVLQLRQALAGEPGNEWRGLARRLMGAVDGESLMASLLARSFSSIEGMPAAPPPPAPAAAVRAERPSAHAPAGEGAAGGEASSGPGEGRRDRGDWDRGRERDRDRGPRADRGERSAGGRRPDRGRERDRDRPFSSRPGREGAPPPRRNRDEERRPARTGERSAQAPAGASGEREFWEVWSEEKAAREGTPAAAPPEGETSGGAPPAMPPSSPASAPASLSPSSPAASAGSRDDSRRWSESQPPESLPEGLTRLYVNVGRKDGAGETEIRELLAAHVGPVQIEALDVMNTHTYLNVSAADADRICSTISGKQLGDRDLVCERAKPRRR
jgi:ATP-dependent RNA helicase DeaD